ncbi:MAG: phosphatase PAP2 family protein [Pseudomonadota bacterium]
MDNRNPLFKTFGQTRSAFVLLAAIVFVTVIFRAFPDADIAASAIFGASDGFAATQDPVLRSLRRLSINIMKALAVILILMWVLRLSVPGRNPELAFAKLGFATVSLLAGPALVTNIILKDNWGRARPRQIEEFGGEATFAPAWDISNQCLSNCSFVSGETSSAIWLFTMVPFLPALWRMRAIVLIGIYVFIVSAMRIGFGAHFLSDVLLSILLNLAVFWLVFGLFFRRGEDLVARDWALEETIAPKLARFGATIGSAFRPIRYLLFLPFGKR